MSTILSRDFWASFLARALFCFLCSISVCFAQPAAKEKNQTLCFLSDTQDPIFFERFWLAYNGNARARSMIFQKIYALQPASVFHLGDLVSVGSDPDRWSEIDQFASTLRSMSIDFHPIPGNHEYLFLPRKGVLNFTKRFPMASLQGYARKIGKVAVVLFNSNFDRLSKEEEEAQLTWYGETLRELEADSSVAFIIVGCHHSPFTNSRIVSGSTKVREYYLPDFYRSKKCRLFLGGHSHAYERFHVNGKDFLVLGGGGGLQHPLNTGIHAENKDLFSDTQRKRMFHLVTVRASDEKVDVELQMVREDFSGFETVRQLTFGPE